ncbi:radical SAM/SPASM domain-containing protein [Candidatus Latescibacterota bacterium]
MKILTGRLVKNGFGYAAALAAFAVKSPKAFVSPVSVAIEPGNICNLRCPLCAAGAGTLNRPKGFMRLADFKKIINGLPGSVTDIYLWGQGEPFMVPDFIEMIVFASSKGFRTIVSTNGHFLENADEIARSGLDSLIVSIDGADKESYEYYRTGGNFEQVIAGMKKVSSAVKKNDGGPKIILQCLITLKNENDIRKVVSLAKEIGTDKVVFKSLQAGIIEDSALYLPENPEHTRYVINDSGSIETDRYWFLRDRCLRVYYSLQIDWQGNVLPCCFDKNSENITGNVFNESLSDMWNSEKYLSFRNTLNHKGRVLSMCKDCTEGLKRLTIEEIKIN